MQSVNGNKASAVSMRLRPAEQKMFSDLAETYDLFGSTNAVRAAGRVLAVLSLSRGRLLEFLEEYEKAHPDEEPIRFIANEE